VPIKVPKTFLGVNTIHFWAIDAAGAVDISTVNNVSTVGHTVDIKIDAHPALVCPALQTLYFASAQDAVAPDVTAQVQTVSGDAVSQDLPVGTPLPIGQTTNIRVTITDLFQNSQSCVASIATVLDTRPVAVDDAATTGPGQVVTIDVLANDSDADAGDTIFVSSATQGSHGSVSNNGASVTYTPEA